MSSPAVIEQKAIDGIRGLFEDEVQAQAFLNDLIGVFQESTAETLAAMAVTLAGDDLSALAQHAHRLKGIGRNLGAVRLGHLCADLERVLIGAPREDVQDLCRRIRQEVQVSFDELSSVHYRSI